MTPPPDIFLSYSRQDIAIAGKMAAALTAAGHRVWWDQALKSGEVYDQVTETALRQARVVVVLWSKASVVSDWVRSEATVGLQRGALMPVMIEACQRPVMFELRQSADLAGWKGNAKDPRLLAFLADVAQRLDEPASATTPPPPVPAASGNRRPLLIAGAAAALLALAGAGYALRGGQGTARPELRIEAFSVADGVSPTVAANLRDEIMAAFAKNSRYSVVAGTGQDADAAYRLSGRIVGVGAGGMRVFASLAVPGEAAPVWTPRLDRPRADGDTVHALGSAIAGSLGCIVDGAIADGPDRLTPALLPLHVDVCNENSRDEATIMSRIDKLRLLVAAGPGLIGARAQLAAMLGALATGGGLTEAMRAEGQRHAAFVTRADPQNGMGWTAMALLQPVTALAARERYFLRAISVKPSECGCEYGLYADFLASVGRNREAVEAVNRSLDMVPDNPGEKYSLAVNLGSMGQYGVAETMLAKLQAQFPEEHEYSGQRMRNAMAAHDWRTARAMIAEEPKNPMQPLRLALIDAMAGGDVARKMAAGKAFVRLSADPNFLSRGGVQAIAMSGLASDAVAAASRLIDRTPAWLTLIYQPEFAEARRTPAFAALVQRLGLVDYWRTSGHPPDFCTAPGAPPLCAGLGKAR